MSRLLINKIPLWKGQWRQGTKYAPDILAKLIYSISGTKQIMTSGISDNVINNVIDIQDTILNESFKLIELYEEGDLLINLGGDHAIAMGTVPLMVFKYPDLKVIWVDAHTDIHSPDTSPSGNCHGMPVHFASELSGPPFYNKLKLRNLYYYGIRDLDEPEKKIVAKHNIKHFTSENIKENRENAIDTIDEWVDDHPVHLSIDVDALDPVSFPSTGVRANDGLSVDDIVILCERIKNRNLVSVDLVEFNPEIGNKRDLDISIRSLTRILKTLVR